MKKSALAAFLILFAFSNFGFVSDTGSIETKKYPCPFVQQIKTSGECPYSKIDGAKKSEYPYLKSQKSECPFLKGEVKESESNSCPYSGKKESRKSNSNQKIKTLDVKFS